MQPAIVRTRILPAILLGCGLASLLVRAQPLGQPETGEPGDAMIQGYLRRETSRIARGWEDDANGLNAWKTSRPRYLQEYFYMLGLSPMPERSPLHATVTGTVAGDGYRVENLHYQSRPGLYVTGNLYRPPSTESGKRLPAVFYVCGHSHRGRDGNKVAYQSHGIWFARHGYVCLIVDTLQLGEIAAFHHGTYNLQRWWWQSRGYTPAGVEAWNGIRGLDYLLSRPDVDPERIAVTGISGGGAATYWITAADSRVKVAVPVSGMADLEAYVPNRVINGHCDCMFLYNTFQWPWTRIAALIAPRPLLFVNSDQDSIFPMDANRRVINRLEQLYSLFGRGDCVDAVVSVGGHAYRQDIRQAAYRFIQTWLRNDPSEITDSEVDLVSEGANPGPYPIPPERLRVFPTDADLPADQINTTIDEQFVPVARVATPEPGAFDDWKARLVSELRRVTFRTFPESIPPARRLAEVADHRVRMESEEGIEFRLRLGQAAGADPGRVLLVVLNPDEAGSDPEWARAVRQDDEQVVWCEPRGTGETRWTTHNPPNYVERSLALLGQTVDTGRIRDVVAASRYQGEGSGADASPRKPTVRLAGRGAAGLLAAYAAIFDPAIAGVTLVDPPSTHRTNAAPVLLNVLRVCDIPDALGLLAPRPLRLRGVDVSAFRRTADAYRAAGAGQALTLE